MPQNDLEIWLILLPQPLKCWDYRNELPHLALETSCQYRQSGQRSTVKPRGQPKSSRYTEKGDSRTDPPQQWPQEATGSHSDRLCPEPHVYQAMLILHRAIS